MPTGEHSCTYIVHMYKDLSIFTLVDKGIHERLFGPKPIKPISSQSMMSRHVENSLKTCNTGYLY